MHKPTTSQPPQQYENPMQTTHTRPIHRVPVYLGLLLIVALIVLAVFLRPQIEDKSMELRLSDGSIVILPTDQEALQAVKHAIAEMTTLFDPGTIRSYHTLTHLGFDTDDEVGELKGRLLSQLPKGVPAAGRKPNTANARRALEFTSRSTVNDAAEDLREAARAAWSN